MTSLSQRLGRAFDRMDEQLLKAQTDARLAWDDTLHVLGEAMTNAHEGMVQATVHRLQFAEYALGPLYRAIDEVDRAVARSRSTVLGEVLTSRVLAEHIRASNLEKMDGLDELPGMDFLRQRMGGRYDKLKLVLARHGAGSLYHVAQSTVSAVKGGGALMLLANFVSSEVLQVNVTQPVMNLLQQAGLQADPMIVKGTMVALAAIWLGSTSQVLKSFSPAALHARRDTLLARIDDWRTRLNGSWGRFLVSGLNLVEHAVFHRHQRLSPASKKVLRRSLVGDASMVSSIPKDEIKSFDAVCKLLTGRYAMSTLHAVSTATHLLSDDTSDVNAVISTLKSREIPPAWIAAHQFDPDRCVTIPAERVNQLRQGLPRPLADPSAPCQHQGQPAYSS